MLFLSLSISFSFSFSAWEHRERQGSFYKLGREFSLGNELPSTLILDFPASKIWEINFWLSPQVCDFFFTAAWVDEAGRYYYYAPFAGKETEAQKN